MARKSSSLHFTTERTSTWLWHPIPATRLHGSISPIPVNPHFSQDGYRQRGQTDEYHYQGTTHAFPLVAGTLAFHARQDIHPPKRPYSERRRQPDGDPPDHSKPSPNRRRKNLLNPAKAGHEPKQSDQQHDSTQWKHDQTEKQQRLKLSWKSVVVPVISPSQEGPADDQ